jgi:NAD(P)H-dependent FMN reductase
VLRNKPVAVIGASTGLFGATWAQAELRKILQTIGANVVDRELALAQAHQQFDERGSLLASDVREQLIEHIDELPRRRLGILRVGSFGLRAAAGARRATSQIDQGDRCTQ